MSRMIVFADEDTSVEGCTYCGVAEHDHVVTWFPGLGWHGWIRPSAEVLHDRMRIRRVERAAALRARRTPRGCGCLGCQIDGRCDDPEDCSHGCGGLASTPWGTCRRCEDELTGQDIDEEDEECA